VTSLQTVWVARRTRPVRQQRSPSCLVAGAGRRVVAQFAVPRGEPGQRVEAGPLHLRQLPKLRGV